MENKSREESELELQHQQQVAFKLIGHKSGAEAVMYCLEQSSLVLSAFQLNLYIHLLIQ